MAIKGRIKKMSHYKPPLEGRASRDYLLLDFNERTTSPSPKVREALMKFIESERLQVYPEYGNLEAKIAQYAGIKNGQAMMTNGGDQGIDVICRAYLSEGDKVIVPYPEFAMYYQSAGIQGAEILEPRYKEEGSLPLEEILDLMEDEKVKLVIPPQCKIGARIYKIVWWNEKMQYSARATARVCIGRCFRVRSGTIYLHTVLSRQSVQTRRIYIRRFLSEYHLS